MEKQIFGNSQTELEAAAIAVSVQNPTALVTVITVFGEAYARLYKRLDTYTPQDARWNKYWRNGVEHTFTKKQVARYQNAGCIKD